MRALFFSLHLFLALGFRNPVYRTDATNPSGYAENGVLYVVTDPSALKPFDQCKAGEKTYIFPVVKSSNLHTWELAAEGALDTRPAWAKDDFSGPSIFKVHGDRYNLYFSATHKDTNRLSLGVAWSDTITGPYTSDTDPLETKFSLNTLGGFKDPTFFYDDKSDTNFLVYNNNAGTLLGQRKVYIQNLTMDGRKTIGEPREILKTSVKWEEGNIGSPSLIKRNGWYYLFYSAAGRSSGNNVVAVARADEVFGPYMKAAEPVMRGNEKFIDTGSTSVVVHNCSSDVLIYNAYPAGHKYQRTGYQYSAEPAHKMLMIDYIVWEKGWPTAGWRGQPTSQHPHVYTLVGDGCCSGGRAMRRLPAPASRTRYECLEACEHDPICEGFDVLGCKDDPKCNGKCYLYYGWEQGMSTTANGTMCDQGGDQKCYKFDNNIANEDIFLMDDYTCARHMENLEVACVHHKMDCPRKRIFDFETCSRHCNRNDKCESFIHDNSNNLCFLKKRTTQSGLVKAPESYDAVLCAKERRFRVGEYTCQKGRKTADRCIGTCPVTVNNVDECAARCHGMAGCAAFHFNNRRECFLKGLPQEIVRSDSKYGTKLCIKNDICSKGYMYMPGDVPGSGSSQFVATSGIDSADKCAEYCDKEKNCGSYEFSPSELKCNVNVENEPTSKKIYKDYQFCSKKSTGKHAGFIRYEPKDVRSSTTTAAPGAATTTTNTVAEQEAVAMSNDDREAEEVRNKMKEALERAIGPQAVKVREEADVESPKKSKKQDTDTEEEVAIPIAADTRKWSFSVFLGSAIGFGIGFLFAKVDGHCCRKRPQEYASLLGH